jgi:hypothetical protein
MFIMSLSYPIFIQIYIISCLNPILTIKQTLKEQPTTSEWVSLAKDWHANTEVETHIKIKDPGSFNIPISINGVFLGDALCDLGVSINLFCQAIDLKEALNKKKPILVGI